MPDENTPVQFPTFPVVLSAESATENHIVPVAPSLTPQEEEQLLKFLIGLRILGEKRQQRFFQYMETLKQKAEGA